MVIANLSDNEASVLHESDYTIERFAIDLRDA
jgi:hypothetical protein